MKKIVKWVGMILGVLVLAVGAALGWATWKSSSAMASAIDTHQIDFAVPYPEPTRVDSPPSNTEEPLTNADAGLAMADAGAQDAVEPESPAPSSEEHLSRAITRGKHLVEARYACIECHGENFGGGVMVDNPALGRFLGPNLTTGKGSVVTDYTPADWDRIVRHGIKKDGTLGVMPSEDFQGMSDQELSDIVAYIRSTPPVDNVVEKSYLGPVGKMLVATGKFPLAATLVADHHADHPSYPPVTEESAAFGKHLAGVCTSCHRADFSGGPIHNGDPSWLPAANLTPHADGIEGWTFDDFKRAMLELKRPDGSEVGLPMALMQPYAKRMTETELRALWLYIASLPAKPRGT